MSGQFDLTGHVTLVTGGNSGIGLGMARGLRSAGATVIIWGTRGDRTTAAVSSLGPNAFGAVVDVADEEAVTAAMADLADKHGRIDSCFANAGRAATWTPLLDTTGDLFRSITDVNLNGTFFTMREAARHMIGFSRGGSLVATSSLGALMGSPGAYGYAVSKSGIVSIVRSLAVELARFDIRANAILPGWTETSMTEELLATASFKDRVLPRVPVRRWATGEDFAGIAVYLASRLSRYHTGDAILIDGGFKQF